MDNGRVRSLAKAIDLLDMLAQRRGGVRLSELAERAGYPKSTAHALLSTMRDRGLVSQLDDGSYALGMRMFEYGSAVSRGMDIAAAARPYLEKLASLTGANAVISLTDSSGVVAFDYAASPTGVQILPEIGVRLPLHATSQGKLFLSMQTDSRAMRLIGKSGLTPYTPHTIVEKAQLMSQLDEIRRKGYSVEDGEYKIGLRAVSAPVTAASGARCVLTTIGFFRRATSEDFVASIRHTTEQARRMSEAARSQAL